MKRTYIYCPQCGAPLTDRVKFGRVRRACRYCGFIHFTDPKVAVAALVTNGSRVLLVRRLAVPRIGYWALPAGYMDADELPEEALVRELAEETGVTVRVMGLLGVTALAGWTERRGVLLLYRAEPTDSVAANVPVAGDDVSDVRWFEPDAIPWEAIAFESTAETLREWLGERRA